jgi:Asp-tRNA(Asn)/Glu-tRNA(Gln) amidotransferase A subunit family amidase
METPLISRADLQRRIDSGELSAQMAIAQSCAAIDALDRTIGAFVNRTDNVPAGGTGPLRGIAVGIKDIIDTADLPTEMGSYSRLARECRRSGR